MTEIQEVKQDLIASFNAYVDYLFISGGVPLSPGNSLTMQRLFSNLLDKIDVELKNQIQLRNK